MKTKSKSILSALFSAVILSAMLFPGCEKETFEGDLNQFLKSMPDISSEMPIEKDAEVVETEVDTTTEYIYHYDYYEAAAGFNEQIVLNPQTDVIYPGALIKGESILDGTYTLIPAERRAITISTSLTGGNTVSVTVDDPKLSTIREAINNLMSQEYDVPPANMGFTIEQAYSEQQLNMSLQASYKGPGYNIAGGFDYSNKQIKTRLVAKFIQCYYTLDMDLPDQPSDLFKEDVNRSIFGVYMPMYVSTVTFGRMALFTIESELTESEVRAYLNGSYAGINSSNSADFEQLNAHSTMKVYILGGSGSSAGATINGFEDFKNYIQDGGNYSKTSPGAPISYKLRYIRDNSIGKIVFAASYPIVTAIPRTDNIVYDINTYLRGFDTNSTDGAGDELELYGQVYSWPASLGSGVAHDHFPNGSYAEDAAHTFPANTTTLKTWTDINMVDTIMVKINIKEEDTGDDDVFGVATYKVPVPDIIGSVVAGQDYDRTGLKVYDGTEWIDFTMRFNYQMRRIDK